MLIKYFLFGFLFLICFSFSLVSANSKSAEIVFVRTPAFSDAQMILDDSGFEIFFLPHKKGAHIAYLNLNTIEKSPTNLTDEFIAACDPSISFDGKKMLFAGKKANDDFWQIWLYNFEDRSFTQITNRRNDCIQPLWVGNLFHLNDQMPSNRIVFVSREYPDAPFALYSCDLNGENLLKITHNIGHDFNPVVLNNGRVVYNSQYSDTKISLMAINIDGTDLMPYLDEHGKSVFQFNPEVSDDVLYFLERNPINNNPFLSFVSLRRPLKSKQRLIHEPVDVLYPCTLPNDRLLLSQRSQETKCYELVEYDLQNLSNKKIVVSEKKWHCLDAQPILERPQVQGRSTVVDESKATGVFYSLNVYQSNIPAVNAIEPGSVKKVKVYQGEVNQQNKQTQISPLGIAPVEEDGSFHIEVPAETPLRFELLTENNEALISQKSWTWVMPNEKRGCIGCHEDREMVPPNRLPMAITKPAVSLLKNDQ